MSFCTSGAAIVVPIVDFQYKKVSAGFLPFECLHLLNGFT